MADSTKILNLYQIRDLAFFNDGIFKLDIFISIPVEFISDAKTSIEINFSFQFKLKNTTIDFKPAPSVPDDNVPYLILPELYPISNLNNSVNQIIDPFSYGTYFDDVFFSPYFDSPPIPLISEKRQESQSNNNKNINDKWNKLTKKVNDHLKRQRRSLSAHSTIHRSDIFNVISQTLNNYGFDGINCIKRAICENAEMELLIESPFDEILQHLLRVSSSASNENDLLKMYLDAQQFGIKSKVSRMKDACGQRYWQCPFSIFERKI